MYISEAFEYVTSVKAKSLMGKLGNSMQYILNQVSSTKTLLSIYKTDTDGNFEKGYVADNLQCDLRQINMDSQTSTDLSIVHDNCKGSIHKLFGIFINPKSNQISPIFPQELIFKENSTIIPNLLCSEETKIGDYDFLPLKDCDVETATSTILNYYKEHENCLQSLIPTTTPTTTTLEPSISLLSRGLKALGISVNDLTPTEIGKMVLNALNIPFTDPTTTSTTTAAPVENDSNESGYEWGYIAVAGWIVALGLAGKCIWDRYNGKNKGEVEEFLLDKLENTDPIHIVFENYEKISLLIKKLGALSGNEEPAGNESYNEKYDDITDDNQSTVLSALARIQQKMIKNCQKHQNIYENIEKLNAFKDFNVPAARDTLANLKDELLKIFPEPANHNNSDSALSNNSLVFYSSDNSQDEADLTGVTIDQH